MRPGCRLRLADEYFFVALDERTGRHRVHLRGAGLGVAAALLAELVIAGHVVIVDGAVFVANRFHDSVASEGALSRDVLTELVRHPQHRKLDIWLAFLAAGGALDLVGRRLHNANVVRREQRWTLRGNRMFYLPTDVNAAAWPAVRVGQMLTSQSTPTVTDAVLAGLITATGLTAHVLWDPDTADAGAAHVPRVISGLHPSLQELLAVTTAACGDAVLVRR